MLRGTHGLDSDAQFLPLSNLICAIYVFINIGDLAGGDRCPRHSDLAVCSSFFVLLSAGFHLLPVCPEATFKSFSADWKRRKKHPRDAARYESLHRGTQGLKCWSEDKRLIGVAELSLFL